MTRPAGVGAWNITGASDIPRSGGESTCCSMARINRSNTILLSIRAVIPRRFACAMRMHGPCGLTASGDLILETEQGEVRQRRPRIYQVSKGVRHNLPGGYRIIDGHEVRLDVQSYDHTLNLVIDPVLTYSTYIGGTGMAKLNAMSLDSAGNIYLTGRVSSPDFPLAGNTQAPSGSVGLYRSQDRAATWATAAAAWVPRKCSRWWQTRSTARCCIPAPLMVFSSPPTAALRGRPFRIAGGRSHYRRP